MALRHYAGKDIVQVPPPAAPDPSPPQDNPGFESWFAAQDLLPPAAKAIARIAWEAGYAAGQAGTKAGTPSFRVPNLERARTLFVSVPIDAEHDDGMDPLSFKASRTLVAALAYFTDMVLAAGMGAEDLCTVEEAQALLKQLTEVDHG